MQTILSLFIAISSLLVNIQATPNLAPEVKKQMIAQASFLLDETKVLASQLPPDVIATSTDEVTSSSTPVVAKATADPVYIVPITQFVPVYSQPAPVTQQVVYPPAPTCTLIGSLTKQADGYHNYLRLAYNTTDYNIVKYPTVDGKDISKGYGDNIVISTTTTYHGVVKDVYGQEGDCDVTLTPPLPDAVTN